MSRALVGGTIDLPRNHGARAVEAYPMKPAPGKDVSWGEMHVDALSAFLAAGVPDRARAVTAPRDRAVRVLARTMWPWGSDPCPHERLAWAHGNLARGRTVGT